MSSIDPTGIQGNDPFARLKDVPEFTAAIDDYYERAKEDGTVARVLKENGVDDETAEFYLNGR